MISVLKIVGRLTILVTLTTLIIFVTILIEITIDNLTVQARDLRHLFKHSMGNIGTLMVLFSLAGYMTKKRYHSFPGRLQDWLSIHLWFAPLGVILVSIHTGAHFKAAVPVAASLLMLAGLISGFVGRYVYMHAKRDISKRREKLIDKGLSPDEAEETIAFAAAATKSLSNWRKLHRPLALFLGFLLVIHIISALYFGG